MNAETGKQGNIEKPRRPLNSKIEGLETQLDIKKRARSHLQRIKPNSSEIAGLNNEIGALQKELIEAEFEAMNAPESAVSRYKEILAARGPMSDLNELIADLEKQKRIGRIILEEVYDGVVLLLNECRKLKFEIDGVDESNREETLH